MKNKEQYNNNLLLTLLIVILLIILLIKSISLYWDNQNLLDFPKQSKTIGLIIIVFFVLITSFQIYRMVHIFRRQKSKKRIIRAFIYTSISLSFIFNLLQFYLYSSDPNSYLVDDKIVSYYNEKEITKINDLKNAYEKEISVIEGLNNLFTDSIINTQFIKSSTAHSNPEFKYWGNYVYKNGMELYFREYYEKSFGAVRPKYPPGFEAQSISYISSLVIATNDTEIIIDKNDNNKKYFDPLYNSNDKIKTRLLNKITNIHSQEREQRISKLIENKNIISKRGLPIDAFLVGSFTAFISDQDYKPLNLTGRLILLFQFIFTVSIVLPFANELYLFLKKKLDVIDKEEK